AACQDCRSRLRRRMSLRTEARHRRSSPWPQTWWWRSSARPRRTRPAEDGLRLRRPILRKDFLAPFAAVVVPPLASGVSEAWFGYQDRRAMLDARLLVEASAAAARIQGFLDGIRSQMQWAVQLPWTDGSVEDHRIDALRLLRQVPAIAELTLIDGTGIERLT